MKFIFFLVIFFFNFNYSYSQNKTSDINLLKKKDYNIILGDNNFRSNKTLNNKSPIIYKHKSFLARYNPFSLIATAAMLFYQNVVSAQIFRQCIYERSCSNFSKKAISEFGLIKGIFISADRLLRCNEQALNDIPPDQFDEIGLAIDEPSKYRLKK